MPSMSMFKRVYIRKSSKGNLLRKKSKKNTVCTVRYGDCVIKSSYNFQGMFPKFCRYIVGILKTCLCVLGGARLKSDRITALHYSFS